jgi:dihydrofolate synthase/folylpolyglutamate synthase
MRWFADEGIDVGVVEVGLGGRTDCTNVFDEKPVTVITNIELEHTERLGKTRAAIAREKAAIIRGVEVVVTGERHRDALSVIEERCAEVGAKLVVSRGSSVAGELPLMGSHQASNAAMAVDALLALGERTGMVIDKAAIRAGLAAVRINGRMETVQESPRVILDGAHNPAEARALAAALDEHVARRGTKIHLVCGILADKDQAAMVRALAPVAASVVVTQPPLVQRQGEPAGMIALFEQHVGAKNVRFEEDPSAAFDLALSRARSADAVVATGSMFLIGHLRERWVPEATILRRRSSALASRADRPK